MNAFQIKVIAITAMIIDHMGLFFFPQFIWLRVIGRLAFPLFAWLIANGARHTHNIKRYLIRLFLFALLAQVPFMMANRLVDPHFQNLNVLFTLFLGLLAIFGIQKTKYWVERLVIIFVCVVVAQIVQTDYGGFGVALVIASYLFFTNFKRLVIAQSILFLIYSYVFSSIEIFGLVSLIFISLYNNRSGLQAKYLFYVFYPMQYVLYYIILLWVLRFIH